MFAKVLMMNVPLGFDLGLTDGLFLRLVMGDRRSDRVGVFWLVALRNRWKDENPPKRSKDPGGLARARAKLCGIQFHETKPSMRSR